MNITEKIDQVIENIDNKKLSNLFVQTAAIALELEDYESWAMLMLNINGIYDNDYPTKKYIIELLNKQNLNEKLQEYLMKKIAEEFIEIRKLESGKVSVHPIQDIENILDSTKNVPFPKQETLKMQQDCKDTYRKSRSLLCNILFRLKASTNNKESISHEYSKPNTSNIFIIHGHDEAKRRELYTILKDDFNLNPIILSEKPNKGSTIIEKFECYAETCSYAFALFTPDDIVEKEGEQYFQARPNVIFELGWFFARLGRDRVCILNKESTKNNIFSDLQGILRYEFKKDVKERYAEIEKELVAAKIIAK